MVYFNVLQSIYISICVISARDEHESGMNESGMNESGRNENGMNHENSCGSCGLAWERFGPCLGRSWRRRTTLVSRFLWRKWSTFLWRWDDLSNKNWIVSCGNSYEIILILIAIAHRGATRSYLGTVLVFAHFFLSLFLLVNGHTTLKGHPLFHVSSFVRMFKL